jgi:hypothetical protein
MFVEKVLRRGYASVTYLVKANEGETLTKESVEDAYDCGFGCHVIGVCATQATVTVYTD